MSRRSAVRASEGSQSGWESSSPHRAWPTLWLSFVSPVSGLSLCHPDLDMPFWLLGFPPSMGLLDV